jgi:O-antigen ligase
MDLSIFHRVTTQWILLGSYLFLMGFFVAPSPNSHKTIFYLMVLLPFFLVLPVLIKSIRFEDSVLRLFILVLLYLSSAFFWGESGELSVFGFLKRSVFILAFLFVCIWAVDQNPRFIEIVFAGLIVCSFFIGIWLIIDSYIIDSKSWSKIFRPEWRFRNQNHMAKAYGFVILLLAYFLISAQNKIYRKVLVLPLLVSFFVVIMSKSSGALLALILSLPLLLFVEPKMTERIKRNIRWILFVILLASLMLYLSGILDHHLKSGWSHRDVIWMTIFKDDSINKLYGLGYLQDARVFGFNGKIYGHEHNLLVALYRQSGIIGVTLYSAFVCFLFLRSDKQDKVIVLLWVLLAYGLLTTMPGGQYPIQRVNDTWLMTWIPMMFLVAKHQAFLRNLKS